MLNKYRNLIYLLLLIFFLLLPKVTSSNDINFDLNVRYRAEKWDGMNHLNFGDGSESGIGSLNDLMLLQRTIFGLSSNIAPKIKAGLHIQDSRIFGWSLNHSENPDLFKVKKKGTESPYYIMNPNEEFFEIYDAYIRFDSLLSDNLSLIVGRQKIFYGDYRIFGPGEWGNTGRWNWDAVRFSYTSGRDFIDIWIGSTKIHDPDRINIPFVESEFKGVGFYSRYNFNETFSIEPFYSMKWEGNADYIKELDIKRHWIGARMTDSAISNFDFDLTYVKGFGSEGIRTINSDGLFARLGYKFDFIKSKPLLSIRYTYASGGNNEKEIRNFQPVFGANDKFYGWMNIISWSNINNPEVVLELFPSKNSWVEIKYNRFLINSTEGFRLLNTLDLIDNKNHLGDEIDLFARYRYNKYFQFTFLFCVFMPKDVKPINDKKPENATYIAFQTLFNL